MDDICQHTTELDPDLYGVVWFAPLEVEAQAAAYMLDHKHQGHFPVSRGDNYVFQAGDICGHNVIIATFPAGQEYGTGSAAALASQVKKFFPNLWFGLLVGVAAGLPNLSLDPPLDIRLGDVLVALPLDDRPAIIAYDLGKETGTDGFQLLRSGYVLADTEPIVRSAIGAIRAEEPASPVAFLQYYEKIKNMRPANGSFLDPGQEHDHLYQVDNDLVDRLTERQRRPDSCRTRVWYGSIGSGQKLMKNAQKRKELRDKYKIIGLEMEAAGIMNLIPVGVIRGVCDYGDEYKNKEWQPYAAALAAAYAKAVLSKIPPKSGQTRHRSMQHKITGADYRRLTDLLLSDPRVEKTVREHYKRSIWKDGFYHGFQLDKVPLIHRFVGRHEYISALEADFLPDRSPYRRKTFVLYGMGGIGKTQLAVEFARRHQTTFSSTFFIDGSSKDAVLQSFMRVFRRIVISDIQETTSHSETDNVADSTPEKITAKALEWFSLEGNHKWLLIFDNVDLEPSDPGGYPVESFFPARDWGSIIVTTRLASLAVHGTAKQIKELDPTQSIELLTGHTEEAMSDFQDNAEGKPSARVSAEMKLVQDLGGLPLALSQAGKLMKSLRINVEEYLELYKSSKRKVIDMLPPEVSPNDPTRASIRSTWTTSVGILKSRMANEDETGPYRCAYRLLHLLAYFEPTDYDYKILEKARLVNNVPAWCKQVFDSKLEFYSTAKLLLDLSLLDRTGNSGSYSMHRVVHDWLCTYIAYETDDELLNLAAAAIAWSCPVAYAPFIWAEEERRLIRHANILYPRLKDSGYKILPIWYDKLNDLDHQRAAELWECDVKTLKMSQVYHPLGDVARLLSAGGRTQSALSLIEDSIFHVAHSLMEQEELYFVLLHEKYTLLCDIPDFSQAEATIQQALDGFRGLHNNFWITCSLIGQGSLLAAQGHNEQALEIARMALETSRIAGIDIFIHPAWLAFQNINRILRWGVGDPERRKTHLETVKIEAELVGYNCTNAQFVLEELASVYVERGDIPEAERLFLKLLHWKQELHGRDAIETGLLCQNLAIFYYNLSRIESIEYDKEWLRICALHQGREGNETGMAHYWLAQSYKRHFQYSKAQRHFEKALAINQKPHGSTATGKQILRGLIEVCRGQGNIEMAVKYEKIYHHLEQSDSNV